MKQLRNHLIGVDQGTKILFSDFEDSGAMWVGAGPRQCRTTVMFSRSFRAKPSVQVTLEMWDIDHDSNQRVDISAENINIEGFDIVFNTWGDTKIARVRAAWLAIGEVKGEDEWDLY